MALPDKNTVAFSSGSLVEKPVFMANEHILRLKTIKETIGKINITLLRFIKHFSCHCNI